MNWTGGRLQRHSNNRSSNLARNQKQKFAKSRLRSTKDSRQAPSLIEFATFGTSLKAKSTGDETQRHGLASQVGFLLLEPEDCVAPWRTTANPSPSRLARDSSVCSDQVNNSQSPDIIEHIKRQLLETTDWAAVGAARPLKISFTPVEEVEHFGKRRRLTEADRTRITAVENSAVPSDFIKSRRAPRQNITSDRLRIEDLEIKINGRRCHAGEDILKERHENFSSQPMLLDRDVSVRPDQGSDPSVQPYSDAKAWSAREDSVDRSLYCQKKSENPKSSIHSMTTSRSHLSEAAIPDRIPSSRNHSGLIQTPGFLGQDFGASISTPWRHHDSNKVHQSSGSIIQNRFTIDDQIAAEKGMCSNDETMVRTRPRPDRHRGPQLEQRPFSQSSKYSLSLDQSFGHHEHERAAAVTRSPSGWLPEPRCSIRRPLNQKVNPLYPLGPVIQKDTPCGNSRTREYTSPMVIIGQPIDIAGDQASNGTTDWMSTPWNSAVKEPKITSLTEDSHATSIYGFASQSPDNPTDTQGSSRVSHTGIGDDGRINVIDRIYTGTPSFSDSNPGSTSRVT
ncbi:uncharacterized protein P174DRAFT_516385 [Aspergillus novofumigatus IBT 16806]|uniref:Uncharacterized protein n=1 Tax=Aspergillus novofumigatus (strain IBT 16806) TaxID=1392255 RepID=A0A2I1BTQ8_ASPN1|nr:uncharacterized protein P174DRAFT_516385 [Aspergillus novofumigatus IBT 16806]PKX88778.1 hypothetical protein P174DRAFT_516385 [Aspergillus novofumigatus IBT 16806]